MGNSFKAWKVFAAIGVVALAAVGCAITGSERKTELSVPSPVIDNGLELAWGNDVKTTALEMIKGSRRYCALDMYELSDQDVENALIDAHHRGVDVQVVVDATEQHSQSQGLPALRKAGVPVRSLRIHQGISHIKMLVADGPAGGVIIGGMNFGANSWSNNDGSVHIPNPNPSYLATFRSDWERAGGAHAAGASPEAPYLNERKVQDQVVQAITEARSSICMEAFNLSDKRVLSALEAASRRGVLVEVLLDPHQVQNTKSADGLRKAGATVRFYRPYSTEWMHAKMLDVDHGDTFIIGSANFSHQAYTYNHEGDIELHGYKEFDKALESNISLQIARGTDYPVSAKRSKSS